MRTSRITFCRSFRIATLGLLACTAISFANGPIPPPEVRWVDGQLLVQVVEGVDLYRAELKSGSVTPGIDELNQRFGVVAAELVMPQYRPTAMEALRRSTTGRSMDEAELELMDGLGRWMLLKADPASDVEAMAAAYAKLDEVTTAEPNYIMDLVDAVPDQSPPRQSGDRNSSTSPTDTKRFEPNDLDFSSQWGLEYINAPEAWDITMGDPSQVIAIIDTGVDLDHPDLVNKIWSNADEAPGDGNGDGCPGLCGIDDDGDGLVDEDREGRQMGEPGWDASYVDDDDENSHIDDFHGWDWISNGEGYEDNDPQDDNGHGTHCAGIAAAETNNGIGIAGACPLCTIMPLKAFQSSGTASFSDIAKAIEYAWRNDASVISMSFGSCAESTLLKDTLSLAWSRSTLVAAAGNFGLSRFTRSCSSVIRPFYPAHYSYVLGVEAGNSDGSLAGFSNCQYELRNPGSSIYSTVVDDVYATWSGTSMAAPLVAGTAGLLRAYHAGDPTWGPDLVFGQMVSSVGDSLQALTLVAEPKLVLVGYEVVDPVGSCTLCDGDGVADSGETVDLVVTIRNLWANAIDVTGTLSTTDALTTVVNSGSTWGAVGPAAFDDNGDNPFRISIDSAAGNNRDIIFNLAVNAVNGGTGIDDAIGLTIQRGLEKGGILSVDETWTADNLYLVTSNLLVDTGMTLTIEPGTRVQIAPQTSISVRGELIAIGTTNNRVVFTGNPSGWQTIEFTNSAVPAVFDEFGEYVSGSAIMNAVIEKAGVKNTHALVLEGGALIKSVIFRENSHNVLYMIGPARIEKNLFTGNGSYLTGQGFSLYLKSGNEFSHNTVVGNQQNQFYDAFTVVEDGFFHANNIFGNFERDLSARPHDIDATANYWGTTNPGDISQQIFDFFDYSTWGIVYFDPPLPAPDPAAPSVVVDITLTPPSPVGAERVTFTITFSKPMNTAVQPEVFFGPAKPYTSHPVDLNPTWVNDTTFEVEADITVYTGDGLQTITVWNAEDLEHFPIPTGDHRFGFEIVTSGTSSAQLQAAGDVGFVDLSWFASDLPDVAGYNVYRADTSGGMYTKLNGPIVTDVAYADHTVEPGVEYFYVYRVVNTELEEGPDSDEASAAALDDIPPVIVHTPVTSAPAGLPVTITAEITDNVATPTASLFHRELGSADSWSEVVMINATGDQFTANVPGGAAVAPGVEYYLEASDGVNTVQDGTPASPHAITIVDQPTIDTVTPDHGPLAGGTPVTITGTNFQSGCTVSLDGIAATSVVVVDPQTITCETPPHHPDVVNATVTNPNMAAGTKTRAYTYDGSPTIVELPNTVHDRLNTTTLGISTPGVEGLISATLEFSYDPAVISVQACGTGNLTSGWTISTNTGTPGTVRLSLAGTSPVTGLGTIAEVTVDVVGDPAAVTALTWAQVELNEGVIPVTPINGQLTVNNAFDVSGAVSYYVDARPVESATMTLGGSASYSQLTAADGSFAIDNVPSDAYTLAPNKADGVGVGDISALDASFVLQYDAGLLTLSPQQQIAGDVNGSGAPTALDASHILRYSVGLIGLPFPGSSTIWAFDPQNRSFNPLDTNQSGQNFAGILLGDTTGNWNSGGTKALGGTASLAVPAVTICGGGSAELSLTDLSPGAELFSVEATFAFDPAVASFDSASLGSSLSGWALVVNDQTPGVVQIAIAGAQAITTAGQLLVLDFTMIAPGSSDLTVSGISLNEGQITANDPSTTMTASDSPTPSITGPTLMCEGDSVTLDAGAGYASYSWSTGETTQTITVSPSSSTSYTVTVTNAEGCSGTSGDHTVTVNPLPEPVIAGPTSVCDGDSVTLDAGAGFSSYLWSTGETTQTIEVSPTVLTNYSVMVTNAVGCVGTSPAHTVTVNPLPNPVIDGPCFINSGEIATLDAGFGYASYLWSTGETTQTIEVSPDSKTSYAVTVVSTEGCEGTDEFVLRVWDIDTVFIDCFESGNFTAWSGVTP